MNTHYRHSGTLTSGCTLSRTGSCLPALAQIVEGHSRADKWQSMSVRGRRVGKGPRARRRGEVPSSMKLEGRRGGANLGKQATSGRNGYRLQKALNWPRLSVAIIKSRENGTHTSAHWRAWPLSCSYSTCVLPHATITSMACA